MAQIYLQPQFDEDDDEALIADLFQALKCTSHGRSQPPSPDRSVPPLPSLLPYANNSSQYQTAAANLDFLPQQFWDNRQVPPVDFFYNPPNATNPTFKNQRKGKGRNQEPSLLGKLTGQEIVSMAGTQTGSMSLQRILDVETAETMLDRITGSLFDLMTDKYGCYVFQKLLIMCTTQKQFEKIVNEVVHNPEQLVSIAGTRFGSLSIQKMFHSLKKGEVPGLIGKVIAVMEPGMLILMREVSGRHLFVDCLNTLKDDHTTRPIYLIAVNNCIELAKDKEGYHVVMKVIETIQDAALRKQLLTTITRQSVFLAQHPNGNFVLQKVIALHNPKDEDMNERCYDLAIYYSNLANATMIGNKSASSSVNGEESSPDNKTVIGYLRYSKGWSEQEIHVLTKGSKDPSLLAKLTGFDITYLSRNQLASNYLQGIINVVETAETILDRVGNDVFDLMGNHYGSFLFRRLLLSCTNKEQLDKIVYKLVHESRDPSELIFMAKTYFGSLSIQKLFRALKRMGSSLVEDLMSFMKPSLLSLMKDHVSVRNLILDCLKRLTYDQNQAIYIAAGNNCIELAEHPDGYRVMETVVELIQEPDRTQLLSILAHHSVKLAQNPKGMLILKKVIQLADPNIIDIIFQNIKSHVVELSMHKQGSHVLEKCWETSGMESLGQEFLQSDQLPLMHRDESALGLIQYNDSSTNALNQCLQNLEEAMQGNTWCICKRD